MAVAALASAVPQKGAPAAVVVVPGVPAPLAADPPGHAPAAVVVRAGGAGAVATQPRHRRLHSAKQPVATAAPRRRGRLRRGARRRSTAATAGRCDAPQQRRRESMKHSTAQGRPAGYIPWAVFLRCVPLQKAPAAREKRVFPTPWPAAMWSPRGERVSIGPPCATRRMSTSGPAVHPTTWVSAGCRRGVFIDCHWKSAFNVLAVGRSGWR